MMRLPILLLLVGLCSGAQPPAPAAPAPEVERLTSLIEELTALKSQVAQAQARIDGLLQALSEQRGALQSNRPAFNAITAPDPGHEAEVKKAAVRCRAFTSAGKRCTRAAMDGSRYCKQHALANQK